MDRTHERTSEPHSSVQAQGEPTSEKGEEVSYHPQNGYTVVSKRDLR